MTISLKNVEKSYTRGSETIKILNNVSVEIPQGEFVALMGPSGSGKSTLLHLIGGLDRPDAGAVAIDGLKINELKEGQLTKWRSRNIGLIFQFYHLMPMLTAEQNVALPLLLLPFSQRQRKDASAVALDLVGLSGRSKHKPGQLSGGEQQRVAIARAIVTDPKILICDEPTGDLDRTTADSIVEILSLLCTNMNKTIILATHDPKVAERANRLIQITRDGPHGASLGVGP